MMIQQCARKNCKAKRAGVYLMSCAVLDCSSCCCDGVRPGKHCVLEQVILSYLIVILTNINKLMINVRRMLKNNLKNKKTIKYFKKIDYSYEIT